MGCCKSVQFNKIRDYITRVTGKGSDRANKKNNRRTHDQNGKYSETVGLVKVSMKENNRCAHDQNSQITGLVMKGKGLV